MTALCELPATRLADLIHSGALSPVELVDACLDRIDRVQPEFNPFCFVFADQAREAAREAERAVRSGAALGPLHGLPVAFKDFTPTRGHRTTRGSRCFEHWVPDRDPVIVRRFREAGAILLGKTTTPEFAHSSFTRSPLWGHTLNPWDPKRTSGGSSGGSGVAVATGCVALAEGTDMGGSVRIPAAFCGVVGLKPSLGRIPMDILDTVFDNISHFGPLARTVADAALFLRVAEGPDETDIQSQCTPSPLPNPIPGDLSGLRIALSEDLGFYQVTRDVVANLHGAAEAMRAAGARVDRVDLGWTAEVATSWVALWGVTLAAAFGDCLDTHRDRMDPDLVALMEAGRRMDAVSFKRLETVRTRQWRSLAELFGRYDALTCPTMTQGAPPRDAVEVEYQAAPGERLAWLDLTCPFNNVAQCPALSVPSGMTADGLPTAVQIVGRRFDDPTVLRIGAAVERHRGWPQWTPWAERQPS
jgi:Asp-tRNA(Asn)/Glu-tRNA(Gln) amidotransferase A subunit family amidase